MSDPVAPSAHYRSLGAIPVVAYGALLWLNEQQYRAVENSALWMVGVEPATEEQIAAYDRQYEAAQERNAEDTQRLHRLFGVPVVESEAAPPDSMVLASWGDDGEVNDAAKVTGITLAEATAGLGRPVYWPLQQEIVAGQTLSHLLEMQPNPITWCSTPSCPSFAIDFMTGRPGLCPHKTPRP